MAEFIYFFKHNNIDAVKIGRTSGESVQFRFDAFRTYSPFGAKILGFYETENGPIEEKRLHNKYAAKRLNGEFFNISITDIESELSENVFEFSYLVAEIKRLNIPIETISLAIKHIQNKEINYPRTKFEMLLSKLSDTFSRNDALIKSKELGFGERFFELSLRSKTNSVKIYKVGHGLYAKK
jgi:hypothetical protein